MSNLEIYVLAMLLIIPSMILLHSLVLKTLATQSYMDFGDYIFLGSLISFCAVLIAVMFIFLPGQKDFLPLSLKFLLTAFLMCSVNMLICWGMKNSYRSILITMPFTILILIIILIK